MSESKKDRGGYCLEGALFEQERKNVRHGEEEMLGKIKGRENPSCLDPAER